MEFNRVWSNSGLSVREVEEPYAGDGRGAAEVGEGARGGKSAGVDKGRSGLLHLQTALRRGPFCTGPVRKLDDHRAGGVMGVGNDEVEVLVVLKRRRDQACAHAVGRQLDRPGSAAGVDATKATEGGHGRSTRVEVDAPGVWVAKRLDRPPLDAAQAPGRKCVR